MATLHLLCGKIASGKSTLATALAAKDRAIVIAEDAWLAKLYPGQIQTIANYVKHAGYLREVVVAHVQQLLRAGVSVVLDFPANTVAGRATLRDIATKAGVGHQLHYLDVPDDVCKARLHQRNAEGTHDFAATEAEFEVITSYFVAPGAGEGLEIVVYP